MLGDYGGLPNYIASGVIRCPKPEGQKFQEYRMALIAQWLDESFELIEEYKPNVLITETVPSRGPEIMDQMYLMNVQCTTLQTVALTYGLKIVQVSARSVQAKLALRKKDVKVTKPQVRNGVLTHYPELTERLKPKGEAKQVFEESDAIAIGLWFCKCYTVTVNDSSSKKDQQTDSPDSASSHPA